MLACIFLISRVNERAAARATAATSTSTLELDCTIKLYDDPQASRCRLHLVMSAHEAYDSAPSLEQV